MGEVLAAFSQHAPLRSSASHTSFFDSHNSFNSARKKSSSHSDLLRLGSSSSSLSSSLKSTDSSFSLHGESDDEDSEDEGLLFPSYSNATRQRKDEDEVPPSSPVGNRAPASPAEHVDPTSTPDSPLETPLHSEDDTAVRIEPSHHVDYLSYEWREEDIWSSWRHIVEHRSVYGERSRLENASWRTWAKNQFKLKVVSPETLNWAKDLDLIWLYGPFQPASNRAPRQTPSGTQSRLSKSNSFLHKKPILKKRSMSEVMLQKSISASSLVKQAAAAVQAQQRVAGTPLERRRPRPVLSHTASDYFTSAMPSRTTSRDPPDYFSSRSTSGLQTPDQGERKHIRFDEKVEQCIAVDCKGADDDDDYFEPDWTQQHDDSSDDDMVMMKRSNKKKPLARTTSKSSVTTESKTIAKLEPTTLKSQTDSPDPADQPLGHSLFGFYRSSRLSPSPSQETLRPSNPSTNFLLAQDDDEDDEDPWEPAAAFEKRPGTPGPHSNHASTDAENSEAGAALRRTASGMFMPFENEDEEPAPPGLIGKVVDTVNTARDIAHVIWNVGWRNN